MHVPAPRALRILASAAVAFFALAGALPGGVRAADSMLPAPVPQFSCDVLTNLCECKGHYDGADCQAMKDNCRDSEGGTATVCNDSKTQCWCCLNGTNCNIPDTKTVHREEAMPGDGLDASGVDAGRAPAAGSGAELECGPGEVRRTVRRRDRDGRASRRGAREVVRCVPTESATPRRGGARETRCPPGEVVRTVRVRDRRGDGSAARTVQRCVPEERGTSRRERSERRRGSR